MRLKPLICSAALSAATFACPAQSASTLLQQKVSALKEGKSVVLENFSTIKQQFASGFNTERLSTLTDSLGNLLQARADSVLRQLTEKKSVALPDTSLEMLPYLSFPPSEEKLIANLVFTLGRMGGLKSLNYEVKKGDTLRITYKVIKGAGFDEIEVLEGKELRFSASKSKKGEEQQGGLVAAADGVLTVNLTNRGLTRSKGTLVITKRPVEQALAVRFQCDTVENTVKVKRVRYDTLSEKLLDQQVSLSSTREITMPGRMSLSIPFVSGRNYLAWGFWIGSKRAVKEEWTSRVAVETAPDPLTRYLLTELGRKDYSPLPEEENRDIDFSFRVGGKGLLRSADGSYAAGHGMQPTLNRRSNFAGFSVEDSTVPMPPLDLLFVNRSRLYAYQAQINIVGLYTQPFETEEEVTEKTCKQYAILSIQ